jgi:hypothetical protein
LNRTRPNTQRPNVLRRWPPSEVALSRRRQLRPKLTRDDTYRNDNPKRATQPSDEERERERERESPGRRRATKPEVLIIVI